MSTSFKADCRPLLSMQVLLGYVLLAALVTRFAVLFTAGGPIWANVEKGSLLFFSHYPLSRFQPLPKITI
jgi:hypothetical protein